MEKYKFLERMKMSNKESKKWSYLCDNSKVKCPDTKWKKVRHKYINEENFNFKGRTENLLDVKKILDSLRVPFFLTHGALLGAYRDGEWIKWDDDIELDIFDNIFKKKYERMCEILIKQGFIIRGRKIERRKEKGEKINLYRNKEKISIRGIYEDCNYEQNKYYLTNVFQYPKKFHDNPEDILFKNEVFKAPGPIEEFLNFRYGDSWRIPINVYTSKGAKKDNFKILYKRGVRRPGV
jgi:hypothetical protein